MLQRMNRRQPAGRARLHVEVLEGRTLPAGNVAAFLLGGDLIVVGDHADNAVEIRVTDGNLVVKGRGGTGTTVNGSASAVFQGVPAIADDLKVLLGVGDDMLDVVGVGVGGDVSIQADGFFAKFAGGHGDDQILLDQMIIGGNLDVSTGGGDDAVLLERSTVASDTTIKTGAGDDRLALVGVGLGDSLTLDTGAGNDKLFLTGTAVGGPTSVRTGAGRDDIILHGVNPLNGPVSLDGGSGKDRAEIDAATTFAAGLVVRRFETVAQLAVTEFIAAEGLAIRRLPFGDPAGTGSSVFSLNGANFAGGEVTFFGIPPAYASAPTTYVAGPDGATITFDTPVEQVRFFFVHFPGAPTGTATAYDAAGNVVAVVQSNQTTFIGDPGNFVTLAGDQKIARVVIRGGMIDNVSFS